MREVLPRFFLNQQTSIAKSEVIEIISIDSMIGSELTYAEQR